MQLDQLRLRNFRCFAEAQLDLDPDLNWIVGPNASGKTSLLEALFFLGHGRSFRSSRPDRLIRDGQAGFEVVARLNDGGRKRVLGVGRADGATEFRLAGETLKSMAEAAKTLPVVVLDSGMNQLVSGGPGERRRWLDWGVFHVEHEFHAAWRSYQQAVKQRNSALRAQVSVAALKPWSHATATAGERLAAHRERYYRGIATTLTEYAERALPGVGVEFSLRQGWTEGEPLAEVLARHEERERELGSTRYGPHRADLQMRVSGLPADERLSRGQQKMLAGAMWLTQVQSFTHHTGGRCLLLVDDLAAELDGERLERFLGLLQEQAAQRVLTAIGDDEIAHTGLSGGKVFHVEHGELKA